MRAKIATHADDRPLADDIEAAISFIDETTPGDILSNLARDETEKSP